LAALFFFGTLAPLFSCFGETDGDGLFSAGYFFAAAAAFQGACFLFFHGAFDFVAGAFGILSHSRDING
jgi:hypothetical protein